MNQVSCVIDGLTEAAFQLNRPWKKAIVLAGLYYSSKTAYSTLSALWNGFKTFGLPLFWPRNFVKEYGEWAGEFHTA